MSFSLQLNLYLTALQSLLPINQLVANLISPSRLQQKVFWFECETCQGRCKHVYVTVSDSLACLGAMHLQEERSQAVHSKSVTIWPWTSHLPLWVEFLSAKWGVEDDSLLGPFLCQSYFRSTSLSLTFTAGVPRETGPSLAWFSEMSDPTGHTHSSGTIIYSFGTRFSPVGLYPREHCLFVLWQLIESNTQCFDFLLQKWGKYCTLLTANKTFFTQHW